MLSRLRLLVMACSTLFQPGHKEMTDCLFKVDSCVEELSHTVLDLDEKVDACFNRIYKPCPLTKL